MEHKVGRGVSILNVRMKVLHQKFTSRIKTRHKIRKKVIKDDRADERERSE